MNRWATVARRSAIRRERPTSIAKGKRGRVPREGSSDWVEDGGVDEAFVRAKIVVGEGEVGEERGFGEGADGLRMDGLGFGAEQDAGGGVVFLRELPGVEVVCGGEEPGAL